MHKFTLSLIFAALLATAGFGPRQAEAAESADSPLAGLLDDWGDEIVALRQKRLGASFAFAPPAEPPKESLHWKARTEENRRVMDSAVARFADQLDMPARFPDIAPLQEATPFHIAAIFNRNPEVLQSLADGGGQVNAVERDNGATPLHAALYANRPLPVIAKLTALGADVNAKLRGGKYHGAAPLHLAAVKSDKPEVVAHLVRSGADIDAVFKYKFFSVTPLNALQHRGHAAMRGNSEVLALLEGRQQ